MNLLKFDKADRLQILENLKEDTSSLLKGHIMDYSLLLGIEKNILFGNNETPSLLSKKEEEAFFNDRHRFLSSD